MKTNLCPACGEPTMAAIIPWEETQTWTLTADGELDSCVDSDGTDGNPLYYECQSCQHRIEVEVEE
jgi:hypothetical protein